MENRTKSLMVHLSDTERESLRKLSEGMGLKMGQYVRLLIRQAAEEKDKN